MSEGVDLVVNCFERSYRDVLTPGFFPAIEQSNRHPLACRTALINNVDDREDAQARAQALLETGEIDRYDFVADTLPRALAVTGLTQADLGRVAHFSDCAISAIALDGPEWLLYWDSEVRLETPVDWISPALELMGRDPRVLVANPNWEAPTLEQQTIERSGDFALGHGFSDQLFLARRAELAAPIYGQRCLAELRFPIAHLGPVFESRVDAYIRHNGRLRATHTKVRYLHPEANVGTAYPADTVKDTLRAYRNRAFLAALDATPRRLRPRCLRYV